MNISSGILLGVVIAVIISVTAAATAWKRRLTLVDFFYGEHRLGLSPVVNLLLSSPFSLNGVLYQCFLGYAIGYAAILTQVAWCISYVWLNHYRETIRRGVHERTLHGFIGAKFGRRAAVAAAVATVIGFTLQVGWELIVGTSLLSAALPPGQHVAFFWICAFSLAVIVAAYTMLGGIRGNARANTVQNLIGAAALAALAVWLTWYWGGPASGSTKPWDANSFERLLTILGVGGVITNIVFSLLWQFVDMSTWQTLASADEDKPATRKSLYLSTGLIFLFPGAVGTWIGMYARSIEKLDSDTLLPHIITLLQGDPLLQLFIVTGLICAMFSTLDGLLLSVGQAVAFDIKKSDGLSRVLDWYKSNDETETKRRKELPPELLRTEERTFSLVRYAILASAGVGAILVVLITQHFKISIFDVVYIVIVAQLALFPAVFSCLTNPASSMKGGAASIASSFVVGLTLVVLGIGMSKGEYLQWIPLISLSLAWIVLKLSNRPVR